VNFAEHGLDTHPPCPPFGDCARFVRKIKMLELTIGGRRNLVHLYPVISGKQTREYP
jgi:hypothetical protein